MKAGAVHEKFDTSNTKAVKVILLRYGINEKELLENYQILSENLERDLVEDEEYEVAFDITHSFRSLPVYNLVVLNYLRAITKFKLDLKHVYYGSIEVKNENNSIAPIVDLRNLTQLLDLTNGVSEFKNTGNAVTLLSDLPEEQKELRDALMMFDWATQLNDCDKIISSLKKLLDVVKEDEKEEYTPYTALKKMLNTILKQDFLENQEITAFENKKLQEHPERLAEIQYLICKWYLNQNRYGQAISTGLEALRSYLVIPYLEAKGIEASLENCRNENYRKNAIQKLGGFLNENCAKNSVKEILKQVETARKEAVWVRNMFAHTLYRGEEDKDFDKRQKVAVFVESLEKLRKACNERKEEVAGNFSQKDSGNGRTEEKNNTRLIISNPDLVVEEYKRYHKTINSVYDLYMLPKEIQKILKKRSKGKGSDIVKSVDLLVKYIDTYFDKDEVQLILARNLSNKQKINYTLLLQEKGIMSNHIYFIEEDHGLQPSPRGCFEIEYVDEEDCNAQNYLSLKPIVLWKKE